MSDHLLVAYLTLEYVSIILFIYLIAYCHYRKTNITLQIFCGAAILNNINETMLILRQLAAGVETIEPTRGEPICTVNAVIEHFIPLVLTFFASCIGFHIWYVVVVKSKTPERQMIKWYCLVSIGVPLFTTVLACILLRDRPNLTAYPRRFYCELADTPITAGTFALPLIAASVPGMVFAMWTALVLLHHIRSFRQLLNPPRMSGLHIGHSLRLVVFTIVFAVIILMTALERIIYIFEEVSAGGTGEQVSVLSDFSGSVVGVGMFLVFGTTYASLRTIKQLLCCQGLRPRSDDDSESGSESRSSSSTSQQRSRTRSSFIATRDSASLELDGDSVSIDIHEMLRSCPTNAGTTHYP